MSGKEAAVHALIRKAGMAPSSHNTQPWLFRASGSAIDLYADPSRALPVNDPQGRELIISCGCALMNLRVAAAEAGLAGALARFPDRDQPGWLARLCLVESLSGSAEEAGLAPFIDGRRTCRQRFLPSEVDASLLEQLMQAARCEGAWLHPVVAEAQRQRTADLVAEGDARQWANPDWRRELAHWLRPPRRGDGLAVPAMAAPLARFVVCRFDLGARVGAKNRRRAALAPLLVVLGTDGDQRHDWLRAGQALERVLLVACRHGLQASYLNQPLQVAALRHQLESLVGRGSPQLLLCLGYPDELPAATPRREVVALLGESEVNP